MTSSVTVAFDVVHPERSARFWAALLDRPVQRSGEDDDGLLLPGTATQVGLRFLAGDPGPGRPDLHLHLTSETDDVQTRLVETVLRLGGRHHDVGQRPDEGHVVLADPEGVELCVIEAGNAYLAGCGPLGEVACDGSRAVGLFWSAALGWPMVWEQDDETAVQAPAGGTKVAWGGESPPPDGRWRNAQRLEVDVDDIATERTRLLALGAREPDAQDAVPRGGTALADPDGHVLVLRPTRD